MSGFSGVELGKVLALRKADVVVQRDAQYEFAGMRSFGRGVFRASVKAGSSFSYRTLTRVRKDEFIYPKLMAWEGGLGVVPAACDGLVVSPEFCVFEIDQSQVLPRWLGLYFKQPSVWPALAGGSAGTNMRRRRIYPANFLRFKVPIPSVDVQRDVLRHADAALSNLDEYQTSVSKASNSLDAALLAEFHRISDTAPRRAMSAIAPLVRREVAINIGTSYPEMGVRSFGRGTFHKPPLAGADVGTKRLFQVRPGDLVFNIVFAWEGAVAVARSEDDGRVGSHRFLTCVTADGHALAEYLLFHFLTDDGLAALGAASPGGAGRNRTLGLQGLGTIEVPVPPLAEQQRFVEMLRLCDDARARHQAASARCESLVPELLRSVFSASFGVEEFAAGGPC